MLLYLLIGLGAAVLLYLLLRSVTAERFAFEREAFDRDREILPLLEPFAIRLAGHQDVAPEEIEGVARLDHARPALYEMLHRYGHDELFPAELLSTEAQAVGILAHSLMHPQALGAAPTAVEAIGFVDRDLDGRRAEFRVLRYRLPDGHPHAASGWMTGVVGPFFDDAQPYLNDATAHTRTDATSTTVGADELIDELIAQKHRSVEA